MLLLADQFELIVPDLRGFGDSGLGTGGASASDHAKDIFALLDRFEMQKVGIVSHDVGGAVAQALAHLQPDRLSGLFFFAFLHPGIGDRFFSLERLANVWYMFFHLTPLAGNIVGATANSIAVYFTFFLRDWAHHKHAFDDVLDQFISNFQKPGNVEGGFAYYRSVMPSRIDTSNKGNSPPPKPIFIPTCVRWSEYDKLFDYAWTDTLINYFPNLDLAQFPDVGHFPRRRKSASSGALHCRVLWREGKQSVNGETDLKKSTPHSIEVWLERGNG